MFLSDVLMNYWAVLTAAVVFYVLGIIWYLPCCFGNCCSSKGKCCGTDESKTGECCVTDEAKKAHCLCKVGLYVVEFFICLVIAYVLALFIELSQAEKIVEGITVACWAWFGFIATTHLSRTLWGHQPIKAYLLHEIFLLIGFIVMGAIIVYMGL